MKSFLIRCITGIAYLLLLTIAFFGNSYLLVCIFLVFIAFSLCEYAKIIKKIPQKKTFPTIIKAVILPLCWIITPFFLLIFWCIYFNANNILVALCFCICANDSLAYLIGSLIGKHKLWLRVSPKKSWEGFIGGIIGTSLFAIAFVYIPYFKNDIFTNYGYWLGFTIVVIIAGTFGDFAESMLKRAANMKDSGSILPGHGGFLDRLDSLLFAVPAGFIYWLVIKSL